MGFPTALPNHGAAAPGADGKKHGDPLCSPGVLGESQGLPGWKPQAILFTFPIANWGARGKPPARQGDENTGLSILGCPAPFCQPQGLQPPRVPMSPLLYKPQTSPTCCFAGATPCPCSSKLAPSEHRVGVQRTRRGPDRGPCSCSPRPGRCLPAWPWPVASAAPALQPISGLPSTLIIFIAGGSWGAGCGEPGAGHWCRGWDLGRFP